MGFIPDIERIASLLPAKRQTLFFSATMPSEITRLANTFLKDPIRVEVARQATTAETVQQWLVKCGQEAKDKRAELRRQIEAAGDSLTNAIIFCNRKRDVGIVQRSLKRHGFDAGELHGDMDQHARTATLDSFRAGRLRILVASDVAARGLDIPAVSHVFNFDIPTHSEDYVHRIGRTGRAGRSGVSVTLVPPSDMKYAKAIVSLIDKDIPWMDAAGAPAAVESEDRDTRRRGRGSRSKSRNRDTAEAVAPVAKPEPVARPANDDTKVDKGRRSKSRNDDSRGSDKAVPFGSSEFVPAFLLRPVRIAEREDARNQHA